MHGLKPPKRKPQSEPAPCDRPSKRLRRQTLQQPDHRSPIVVRELLSQYYPSTHTLRQHLLDSLPTSSRLRRRKIASLGQADSRSKHSPWAQSKSHEHDITVEAVCEALDNVLVCTVEPPGPQPDRKRQQQWTDFSQQRDADDSRVSTSSTNPEFCQSEVR